MAQSRESAVAQRGKDLSRALKGRGLMAELGPQDRLKVIDTLIPLIEGVYCHLPQKRAGYAADPVQALRLLRQQCIELTDGEFHLAVTGIITGLRDAHTRYVGPSGLRDKVAVLPFLVESYGPQDAPRFIVSKLSGTAADSPDLKKAGFAQGVELVSWNFVPMSRAVDVYALQETGGRRDARRARALETLTFRSLDYGPPPDEYKVSIGFRVGRSLREVCIPWRVVAIPPATLGKNPQGALRAAWNPSAESVRKAKTLMFAPATWDASRLTAAGGRRGGKAMAGPATKAMVRTAARTAARTTKTAGAAIGEDLETSLPNVLSARTVPATIPGGKHLKRVEVGYLRIWSFDVDDHEAFVAEAQRLLAQLPQDRL
ncbi:MAG TPA: hypothetical protein VES02_09795, partial [Dermatophilaceae bacterium]|nr:hypothetical protein [Dermatophilaceae bacterium]